MASKKQKIQKNEIIGFNKTGYMIFHIKGVNVMVDSDLAKLYGVVTGALTRAVKRNLERFPQDFMFQLSDEEFENLRCQTGISSSYGGRRYNPYVFTQEGVTMLSSVLRSPRAITSEH
ncbi:MAG: ORF6N domain-containing protein [Proteobacteria bacterium]|nr:ORF6N domain-containing protein [Pseudomonadota bacterium]